MRSLHPSEAQGPRLEITLPLPPSLNGAYRNVPGKGRRKMPEFRKWASGALPACYAVKRGTVKAGYRLHLVLPGNMRGDIDNRIKPTQDLLVKGGVLPDDKHAAAVSAERGVHREPVVHCIITWSEDQC